jgi:primosomal protein N' (replication factor Y)
VNYYEIALLKSPLEPLTYQSIKDLQLGQKVLVSIRGRKNLSDGVIIKKVEQPSFKCTDIDTITELFYDEQMLEVAKFISLYYVCSLGEALGLYTPYIQTNEITLDKFESNIELSNTQQKAFDFCDKNNTSLLFANTGSGKTEIYIKMIEKYINQNKQSILLMPEISLTPQMEKRLKKVFGESVAIWHSKIQKKKKEEIINGVLKGSIKIIAGARSALFLPLKNLGLIIVDEEHDDSYKSDQKPRLNVKDLAIYMGSKYDIKVILGSATPSLTTFAKIPYIRVKETFFDTQKTYNYDESNLSLTQTIIDKLQNRIDKKEQSIIFLPTRANFKYQICSDCGKSIECPFCSVALSLHKNNRALQCHYCNYTQQIVEKCPSCETGILKNYRLGTAELEEQLKELFPNQVIQTFDRDSVKTNTQLKKILKDFNDNKIDILVGTQMLSKGHDYHNVTLAVVLGIDSVLNMTSYKVREKTLSLTLQIAGRSGRSGQGEVLIQTKNKDFFQTYLEQKDYEEFLEEELQHRLDLYPPKIRLARVVFSHKNGIKAQDTMNFYVNQLLHNHKEVQLIGCKECAIFKIANKYRYEILVRSKDTKKLLGFLHSIDSPIASIDMDTLV